jgi:hypothetical protein
MRARLLVLSRFADGAQCILAAVHRLAFVGIKCRPDLGFRSALNGDAGFELRVAAFADTKQRRDALYDSEFPLFHNFSLSHAAGVTPVNIKRHHYPSRPPLAIRRFACDS